MWLPSTRPGEPYSSFRRRGIRMPRQLLLGSSFGLVPESLKQNPAWLQPFRRTSAIPGLQPFLVVNVPLLFPRLNRREGAVRQALIADVIHGLRQQDGPVEDVFADERWLLVRSSARRPSWLTVLSKN
jgi:hypothetical protein